MAECGDRAGDLYGDLYGKQIAGGAYGECHGYDSGVAAEGVGVDYGRCVAAELANGAQGGESAAVREWRTVLGRGAELDDDAAVRGCAGRANAAGGTDRRSEAAVWWELDLCARACRGECDQSDDYGTRNDWAGNVAVCGALRDG